MLVTFGSAWESLPPVLRHALASGATVVTPNNRLARRLAALYDEVQRAKGHVAWPAPLVVPWGGWLERLWLDVLASGNPSDPPRVLSSTHGAFLWKRIIASERLSLIDENGAAAMAAVAWSTVQAWGAGGPSWRAWAGGDDDCAAYSRWADEYSAKLDVARAVDREQLPDWIARFAAPIAGWRGTTTLLAGFVELSPQQQRLIGALRAAGMEVAQCTTVRADAGGVSRALGNSPRDEVTRALLWARDRALANPGAAIGIAIQDLASRRQEVRALAEEILCPALQWPGNEQAARPYTLSLGAAAADVPLVAAALALVRLAHAPLPMGDAASLLRSPYLAGDAGDWLRRARLERTWLRAGRREISIEDVAASLGGVDAGLAHRLRSASDARPAPSTATPREWTEFWRAWLAATGWPGDRSLSSDEWQARTVWDELLQEFAMLGAITRRIPAAEAIGALVTQARDHVFQPESRSAAIEILGTLEAAGLPLDALWVAGLAAEVWPPAPRPNPLLALAWQRERNAPHATAARELAYAQALTSQWTHGAAEVVFSCAKRVDDHLRAMSSLVPPGPWLDEASSPIATLARTAFEAAPEMETLSDERAPSMPGGSPIKGGASAIEAQSDCPFRAMARFRLNVDRWPEPVEGLTAMERGSLVHMALATFWNDVGSQANLVALSGDERAKRIDAAAVAAARALPAARWHRLAAAVRAGEPARIASIVRAWIEGFDLSRPPFSVAAMEVGRPLSLGGLEFALRIDRVDALADGGVVVVDYKTGAAKAPAKWFDARPQGPQIGLYVLAQRAHAREAPVRAAAYAQLKPGELAVRGIAADAGAWPMLPVPGTMGIAGISGWASVEAHWTQSLSALATELRKGVAIVAPRDRVKTCGQCGLQALCRIGAIALDTASLVDD